MKVEKVNNSVYLRSNSAAFLRQTQGSNQGSLMTPPEPGALSFKGAGDIGKYSLLYFRKLSNYMKEASEMTNALIAFIGTSVIAPFAIIYSPKKKDPNVTPEEDREKKIFQALRQIPSALLAFGFQMPTTIGIGKGLDYLAYKKQIAMFDDEILGKLIPSQKYLKKQAKQLLKENPDPKLAEAWKEQLKIKDRFEQLKPELIEQLKEDYKEVGLEISPEKLEKMANDESRRRNFLAEKMAKAREDVLIAQKVEELKNSDKIKNIKDIDLVTSDYQDLAKTRYKEEFAKIREDAKLSKFDKFIKMMGFSNKKLSQLEEAEKKHAQERGLEIMKKDSPEIFKNDVEKLKKYITNRNVKAQKLFGNKTFWLTLGTNLIMVAISCIALNALHPVFADFIDGLRGKKSDKKEESQKKVEVRA